MKIKIYFFVLTLLCSYIKLSAEGSVDFVDYPGYRLMIRTDVDQQMKVYAAAGEYINLGSSHLNIEGGFMEIYRPDGTLHATFDGTNGDEAIIYDNIQELNGPIGGAGYTPGVVEVTAETEGIWSVVFKYPVDGFAPWTNLLNSAPWTRANNQPITKRSVLAWDVTVSQGNAGNEGGTLLTGRVYANEYNSMISENGFTTSPTFYVQTWDGFLYQVDFLEADPFGFPLYSNSLGIVNQDGQPTYQSAPNELYTRTLEIGNDGGDLFVYEPQAEDDGLMINNKLFFNIPNSDLPSEALTTDLFRGNTHTTWLLPPPPDLNVTVNEIVFSTGDGVDTECLDGVLQAGGVSQIIFTSSIASAVEFQLDLNGNNIFNEPNDWTIVTYSTGGQDTLIWNGIDNLGNPIPEQQLLNLNYRVRLRGGETHILMSDVENNNGGVTFELLTDLEVESTDLFNYDHSTVGGTVSGGGTPGNALPTNEPFTYGEGFGNNITLDYWVNVYYNGVNENTITLVSAGDCTELSIFDTDNDGVNDDVDIDDDNDGIPDLYEMCSATGFSCLPGGLDPSGDEDEDGVPNYLDPEVTLCTETILNGTMCAKVMAIYDLDGDNIPDHLDLDSDNDGITDLYEAAHNMVDANGDGRIDGENADFGANGLFNALATDPDDFGALANYIPKDKDGDFINDYDDLDSDNDGIHDVLEAQIYYTDPDNDGRLGDETLIVFSNGIAEFIAFERTGLPVPSPRDHDGDLVPDFHDLDSDNDLIIDVVEGGNKDDDMDAMIGLAPIEIDANGVASLDAAGTVLVGTSAPMDTDEDILHDFRDLDSDNDLIYDVIESGINGTDIDPDLDGIGGVGMPIVDTDGNGLATADADGMQLAPTSLPADNDADGVPTFRDLDSDNDGINDVMEAVTVQLDGDNDGHAGVSPVTVDEFGIAVADGEGTIIPALAIPVDTDNDTKWDYLDLDSDNDSLTDVIESLNTDGDSDARVGTGIPPINIKGQVVDPNNGNAPVSTSFAPDRDTDLVPNFRDLDADNDGINDIYEGQVAGLDPDNDGIVGTGMPMTDENGLVTADADGVPLGVVYAPLDTDSDTYPDFLEYDTDNDGINDVEEAGFPDPDGDGVIGEGTPMVNSNGQAVDANGDPITVSSPQDTDSDTYPDFRDLDADNDGINDVEEAGFDDPDNDGTPGTGTPSVNINGQPDGATSDPQDTDGDGIPDYQDLDADNDGLSDTVEAGFEDPDNDGLPGTGMPPVNTNGQPDGTTSDPVDTDGDGIPDYQDLDSDSDDIPDEDECPEGVFCPDSDGDGIPDPIDPSCYSPEGAVSLTDIQGAGIFCEGESVAMSGLSNNDGPFVYTWTGPNNFSFSANSQAGETLDIAISAIQPVQGGTYTLIGQTLEGCITSPLSIVIEVNPQPEIPVLNASNNIVCSEDEIDLFANPINGNEIIYLWSFNGTTLTETTEPILSLTPVTPSQTGVYTVQAIDMECESNASNPQNISIVDNTEVADDVFTTSFNATIAGINILDNDYFDANSEVVLEIVTEPLLGTLTQVAQGVYDYTPFENAYGEDLIEYKLCSVNCPEDCDLAQVRILIDSKDEKGDCFYVNTITPNSDGVNDALVFPCLEDHYNENKVKIFNRWGDKVMDQENYKNDWQGEYKGQPLPPATYYYMVEFGATGECVQGYFSIIR